MHVSRSIRLALVYVNMWLHLFLPMKSVTVCVFISLLPGDPDVRSLQGDCGWMNTAVTAKAVHVFTEIVCGNCTLDCERRSSHGCH